MKRIIMCGLMLAVLPAAAEGLNYNVVSFSESATALVANDLMDVRLTVREEGGDRQAVSNAVTRKLNILNARIRGQEAVESELVHRSVSPRYEKGKVAAWLDQATVRVQSRDFQALNKLIAQSQQEAVLQGMNFRVSAQKRSETVNRLSRQALENFQARAEVVSRTLGFSGYKIVNLNLDSSFNSYSGGVRAAKIAPAAMALSDAPEMVTDNPGSEEITQTVSGSIQM
ncbi:SIMPL domain-containing protein [Neisseria leonii]|uniref:SIMPL domain-containing protein n=1 Tax=Neisseria leonii TaxID=2995413 RepID=A0A9X4IA63_9NEIS|nr:SIMPL domain-containing protein [Neisseria sp. 51.81]MDD9327054.1 SIMPL domain-containing protein [Neisseria sp. 51.81]